MDNIITLDKFSDKDDLSAIRAALNWMRVNPGSTLIIPEGEYLITTAEAKAEEERVLAGEYGFNPEPVMFKPDHPYEIGLDFSGHNGSTVIAKNVHFTVDGFMEVVSVRDCQNVTIEGLTIDHKRKPYSKGIITKAYKEGEENIISINFPPEYPVTKNMPSPRTVMYNPRTDRFEYNLPVKEWRWPDKPQTLEMFLRVDGEMFVGNEIYFTHCFHSRPAVLIERANNTTLRNITIHSHNGMGLTAFHATDILIEGLNIVPSEGEHFSTNTDATHFSSCRGKLRLDGCRFEGQGDDSINVHTYYYTITDVEKNKVRLVVKAPTFTHTQSLDFPKIGDTLELVLKETIDCEAVYKVTDVEPNYDTLDCVVTIDNDFSGHINNLPDYIDINKYMFADIDALPELEFVNCTAKNHLARSILIKCRKALVENCTVTDVADAAVKIAAEANWHEGVSCDDVIIRGNRFINNGRSKEGTNNSCGGIIVCMDGAEKASWPHARVLIENNIIENPNCDHCVSLANIRTIHLSQNKFVSGKEPVIINN